MKNNLNVLELVRWCLLEIQVDECEDFSPREIKEFAKQLSDLSDLAYETADSLQEWDEVMDEA